MTTPLGNIVSGWQVEVATLQTIELWLETYLSAVQRACGFTNDSLTPPRPDSPALRLPDADGNMSIDPASIHGGVDFLTSATDLMPEVIVAVVPDQDPVRFGSGDYSCSYTLQVACQCLGQSETLARMYAELYGTAVSALIVQNGDLGGVATRTRWLVPPHPEFVDTGNPDDNLIVQTVSEFTVYVDGSVNDMAGIDVPVETDPITDPDPGQLPPDWPTATAVDIGLAIVAASADPSDADFSDPDTIDITE